MASKNYRVIARKTVYYYVDVIAKTKELAVEQAWQHQEHEFKPLPDPQNEWKVIEAVYLNGKNNTASIDDIL